MGDHSRIEWTDASWNPTRGCSIVSPGCAHCYAMKQAHRFVGAGQAYQGLTMMSNGGPVWTGEVRTVPELLAQPLRWTRRRRIFVDSMSDLFHEAVPDEFIDQVFAVMLLAKQHIFQVLTKRPERMLEWFKRPRHRSAIAECLSELYVSDVGPEIARHWPFDEARALEAANTGWPPRNVWLGVSVERQKEADERIPLLLQTPAAVRWLSCEPLLGRVDLCKYLGMWWNQTMDCWESTGVRINVAPDGRPRIGWAVVGGESGPGARPIHPGWARSLRDQCAAAGVPFFFKQWGDWIPLGKDAIAIQHAIGRYGPTAQCFAWPDGETLVRVGKKHAGRELDGRTHDEFPSIGLH